MDVTTPGTYIISYTVKDSADNEASLERIVKVNANSSISVARRKAIRSRRLRELARQKALEEQKKEQEGEQGTEPDLAKPNPAEKEQKNPSDFSAEQTTKKQEKKKDKQILLTSTCLSLKSERSYLSKGQKLPEIQTLPNFLKSQNYLKIQNTTKYFGNLTFQALKEFQKDNGITPASGVFGRITARYLDRNCHSLKTKEKVEKEKLGKEEKQKEEKKQDFASQNPGEKNNKEKQKNPSDFSAPKLEETKQKHQEINNDYINIQNKFTKIAFEGNLLSDI